MKYTFTILCFLFVSLASIGQDIETATIMQYNLLNYNNFPTGCTSSNNDPTAKEGYFKTIIKHVNPDIICCNEIGNNFGNANKLITGALNTDGVTKYKQCNFAATSGSSLTNMLFYNQELFGLAKQDKIEKAPNNASLVRLIDVYYLYYKDPNLAADPDTTYLVFFVGHFKAGTGTANESDREEAANAVIEYVENHDVKDNYFLAGDFNMYSASEPGYEELTVTPDDDIRFYDPINASGNWNNNSSFAFAHTQSTRTSSSCFSGGGMDDRFDFILMSKSVKDGLHKVDYINNSYKAIGQDGNRFNGTVNSPSNSSEPSAVIDALYNLSDHLPVRMWVAITKSDSVVDPNSIEDISNNVSITFNNPSHDILKIRIDSKKQTIEKGAIISVTGKTINLFEFDSHNGTFYKDIDVSRLNRGIYFLRITTQNGQTIVKKLLKT